MWPSNNAKASGPRTPSTTPSTQDAPGVIQSFRNVANSVQDCTLVLKQLAIDDLALLHHFVTVTYATIDNVISQHYIWEDTMIKIGFKCPFVLRGILALAALHRATTAFAESPQLRIQASAHHIRALDDFRAVLSHVDQSNCNAVFAFSSITVVHAFAAATVQEPEDVLGALLNCLHLVRGVATILQPHWEDLAAMDLAPLLQNGWRQGATGQVPEILSLRTLADSGHDEDETAAYLAAIDECHTTFLEVLASNKEQSDLALMFTWPVSLSEKFMSLLSARDPVALVILAHFGILFHLKRDCWWLRGWHQRLGTAIESVIGSEYQEWLSWPIHIEKAPIYIKS